MHCLAIYDNVSNTNLVITRKILLTRARADQRLDLLRRLSCCEVPSIQTLDNFTSVIVFFHIIATLAWFRSCETRLFPRFVKYVIEIHVVKVELGILHLSFS